MPRLSGGRGALEFARGGTQLDLTAGSSKTWLIRSARIDWPRRGAPRLQASLDGESGFPAVAPVLEAQGLDRPDAARLRSMPKRAANANCAIRRRGA